MLNNENISYILCKISHLLQSIAIIRHVSPGHSTTYQLVDIFHHIFQSFDEKQYSCMVFCDISKAFDKVWHKGLLFKLRQNGLRKIMHTFRCATKLGRRIHIFPSEMLLKKIYFVTPISLPISLKDKGASLSCTQEFVTIVVTLITILFKIT